MAVATAPAGPRAAPYHTGMRAPCDPGRGATVRFFERAGPDTPAALERLARDLVAGGAEVELLVSDDRSDLWLLIARGGGSEPAVDAATRCWRFRDPAA
jgi:hypothetical protein